MIFLLLSLPYFFKVLGGPQTAEPTIIDATTKTRILRKKDLGAISLHRFEYKFLLLPATIRIVLEISFISPFSSSSLKF